MDGVRCYRNLLWNRRTERGLHAIIVLENVHSCISVTDKVKINEQNTASIAIESHYHYTEFERSYLKLWRF